MVDGKHRLQTEKAELAAQLSQSRQKLTRQWSDVGHVLDMPQLMRRSIREKTWQWLGGALLIGGLVGGVVLPRHRRRQSSGPTKSPRPIALSLAGTLLSTSLALFKPALTRFAQREFEKFVKGPLQKK